MVPPCGPSPSCFSESKTEVVPTVSVTGAVYMCIILVARPPYTAWTESSDHGTAMLCQSVWNSDFNLAVLPFLCSRCLTAGSFHMRFSMLAAASSPVFSFLIRAFRAWTIRPPRILLYFRPGSPGSICSCCISNACLSYGDLVAIRAEEAV